MSIFTRYVLRSHAAPAVAGLAIFYFVLSMDFIVDYLDLFIARGVPGLAVLEAFGLSLAWMTLLAVPMAVIVAALTAFGRLSQDNEITAAKANGVPVFSLIAPVLVASALAACGLFYFGNHALPGANHRLKTLLVSIHRMRPLATIRPGVLTELPGNYTIIVDRIDPHTSEIFRVRIYRLESGEPVQTVVAARGRVVSAADSDFLTIELYDGEIHNIDREDPTRYNRLVFERHVINVEGGSAELIMAEDTKRGDRELSLADIRARITAGEADMVGARRRVASTLDRHLTSLLDAVDGSRPAGRSEAAIERDRTQAMHAADVALRALDAEEAKARKLRVEYQKKISIPFACIVFVLLGAPIGIRTRRGGVGIGAGIGMLFFLIYYLFLIGGEQLGDRGLVSPFWAMWAPNVLFGGLGLFLTLFTAREWRIRPVGSIMDFVLKIPSAAGGVSGRRA